MWGTLIIVVLIVTRTKAIGKVIRPTEYKDVDNSSKKEQFSNNLKQHNFYEANSTNAIEVKLDNQRTEIPFPCVAKQCPRKCCPLNQGYDLFRKQCVNTSVFFSLDTWRHTDSHAHYTLNYGANNFVIGNINCTAKNQVPLLVSQFSTSTVLKRDNMLYVWSRHYDVLVYPPQNYCIDFFINGKKPKRDAFVCIKKRESTKDYYIFSSTCMMITCFLILLRVITFAWLPELRSLHGLILMAYLISLLVGNLLLTIANILTIKKMILKSKCVYLTFVVYFSMLSAFFWRNIMCYDIWWTFSGKRAMSGYGSASNARFYLYSAYAFGVPTVLTVLLAALEFSNLPWYHPLMPQLRIRGCFLHGYSKLLYFCGPIMILFVVNMIFFTMTALKIARVKKGVNKVLKTSESFILARERRQFTLYVQLFSIMAFLEVNWILEVISIFCSYIEQILHMADIYNVFVPLFIIIRFMCQKNTWIMLRKRFRQMRGLPSLVQTTINTSGPSLSSQNLDQEISTTHV